MSQRAAQCCGRLPGDGHRLADGDRLAAGGRHGGTCATAGVARRSPCRRVPRRSCRRVGRQQRQASPVWPEGSAWLKWSRLAVRARAAGLSAPPPLERRQAQPESGRWSVRDRASSRRPVLLAGLAPAPDRALAHDPEAHGPARHGPAPHRPAPHRPAKLDPAGSPGLPARIRCPQVQRPTSQPSRSLWPTPSPAPTHARRPTPRELAQLPRGSPPGHRRRGPRSAPTHRPSAALGDVARTPGEPGAQRRSLPGCRGGTSSPSARCRLGTRAARPCSWPELDLIAPSPQGAARSGGTARTGS